MLRGELRDRAMTLGIADVLFHARAVDDGARHVRGTLVDIGRDHVVSRAREALGDLATQTSPRAGDDRDLGHEANVTAWTGGR